MRTLRLLHGGWHHVVFESRPRLRRRCPMWQLLSKGVKVGCTSALIRMPMCLPCCLLTLPAGSGLDGTPADGVRSSAPAGSGAERCWGRRADVAAHFEEAGGGGEGGGGGGSAGGGDSQWRGGTASGADALPYRRRLPPHPRPPGERTSLVSDSDTSAQVGRSPIGSQPGYILS
eukprot:1134599-Prorocentrum_minimum.AAC.1